jgi:hypothetical protein
MLKGDGNIPKVALHWSSGGRGEDGGCVIVKNEDDKPVKI